MSLIVTEMFHLPKLSRWYLELIFFDNADSDIDSFIVKNTYYDKL